MKRFVDGVDRSQGLLLPDRLEDYVHEDNPVRVVEAFVEALDMSALGFDAVNREAGGQEHGPGTDAVRAVRTCGWLDGSCCLLRDSCVWKAGKSAKPG